MKFKKSQSRGYFENSWLKSYHSFSFGEYYDPQNLHFRDLRVINHDFIAPDSGFGTHPHRDMEIMTYVLKGKVAHKDSMGNKKEIKAGEVQIMSAGTGITHSEFNPHSSEVLELLQIWILPDTKNLNPYYDQKTFAEAEKTNKLRLIASKSEAEGSLRIHQDIKIYGSLITKKAEIRVEIPTDKFIWLQLAKGKIEVNGQLLEEGDAIYTEINDQELILKGHNDLSDFVLFELN